MLYPNIFTLLVAPPAVGKGQAIYPTKELWQATKGKIKIAPSSVTKASLLDELADALVARPINGALSTKLGTQLFEYHALAVASTEFGNLVSAYDLEFLSVLIQLYDSEPFPFRETRRHSTSVDISNPTLNMLAGTQPAYLAGLLPDQAWGGGFMSRMVMIYANSGPDFDLWDVRPPSEMEPLKAKLTSGLNDMVDLIGECIVSPEAKSAITLWKTSGFAPIPEHSKLQYYNGRRGILILKLCMIVSASEGQFPNITEAHVERARDYLLHAEELMPDVFRDMVGKSDSQVIQELHQDVWRVWAKSGKKPVHLARMYNFLSNRVPSERISRVIEVAEKSGIIARNAGTDTYVPRGRHEWGDE